MKWLSDKNFYLIVFILLILVIALRSPLDTDMWWHLRAGEETWTSGNVYRIDTLSYTRAGESWINHSWLAQVIMYGLFHLGSFRALSFWVGITATVSMLFVYLQLEGDPISRIGIALLAGFVSSLVWSPRPQLFSLLFFGIVGWLLYRFKWLGKKNLYWLAPIFIIWSNLHGGYVLGVILIFAFAGGEILNKLVAVNSKNALDWNSIYVLIAWGFAGFGLAAFNPNGFGMWMIPFQTVGVESLQNLIQEWASPDFHQPVQQLMLMLLFLTVGAVGLSERRIDGSDLCLFIVFGFLAFTARRNFGPFAMVTGPILARHWSDLTSSLRRKIQHDGGNLNRIVNTMGTSGKKISRPIQLSVNILFVLLLLFAAIYKGISVSAPEFIEEKESEYFPANAVMWLLNQKPSGNLFSTYNWGGYLSWHAREYPVFVDGRTDLFGDEILNDYQEIMLVGENWDNLLLDYDLDILLLQSDSNLGQAAIMRGWIVEYSDEMSIILTKN